VSPGIPRNVRLDETDWIVLRAIETRDGIPVAEQVRRAVKAWINDRNVTPKEKPKPRPSRRSSA
jgi:hypothetical protein